MAERRRRVGRTKSAIRPARVRSVMDRFGDRRRERFRIRSWCLRRSDSATMERAPPGPSKRAKVAMKWMKRTTRSRISRIVTGREIPRNYGRNNNSPATGGQLRCFTSVALSCAPTRRTVGLHVRDQVRNPSSTPANIGRAPGKLC